MVRIPSFKGRTGPVSYLIAAIALLALQYLAVVLVFRASNQTLLVVSATSVWFDARKTKTTARYCSASRAMGPVSYLIAAIALLALQYLAVVLVFRASNQTLVADTTFWVLP